MSFSQLKAIFATRTLACGLFAATAWHGYQGTFRGRDYPFNTFLFLPHIRFTDFYDVITASAHWDPYSAWAIYLPLTYVVLHPFSWLPQFPAYLIYLTLTVALLLHSLFRILSLGLGVSRLTALTAVLLLCCSSPFLVCIDRGNIELTLMWLLCECVYHMRKRQLRDSLLYLVPAICMKIYPVVLLAMLLPGKHLKLLAVSILTTVTLTYASLSLFTGTIAENVWKWQAQAQKFSNLYVIGNGGMGGTASLWNAVKLLALQQHIYDFHHNPTHAVQDMTGHLTTLLHWCTLIVVLTALYLGYHVVVVETSYWRRVSLLTVFMVLATPAGAEYKLIHAITALACMITTTDRRSGDWGVVTLLSLTLIPKKYLYFPHIITDSGVADCSLSVLMNPFLLVAALVVITVQGWAVTVASRRRMRLWSFLGRVSFA